MKFLCKECWIQHDVDTLLAGCEECGARVKDRLEPLVDRHHPGELSKKKQYVCKKHPEELLRIVCGNCKRPVPASSFGNRSVLAVVGDTFSGKTSLMWVVTARMQRPNGDGISIDHPVGDSDKMLYQTVEHIFNGGGNLGTRPTDADVRNYAWEVTVPDGEQKKIWLLAFHDAAGEVWRELANLDRDTHPALRSFLRLVGCVLFVIDGEKLSRALDVHWEGIADADLLFAAEHELRIAKALEQRFSRRDERVPVAVAITKADTLWGRVEWELFRPGTTATREKIDHAVRQLLQRTGRTPLLEALERAFKPLCCFAVSAFGRPPAPGFTVNDIRPARVEEPIVSLLKA
jgi:hypothetical protein